MAVWPDKNNTVNVQSMLPVERTRTSLMLIDLELRFTIKEGESVVWIEVLTYNKGKRQVFLGGSRMAPK